MTLKGGQGAWNSYVEAGKDKSEQLYRLKDVPDKYRNQVIKHMRTVIALKKKNERPHAFDTKEVYDARINREAEKLG